MPNPVDEQTTEALRTVSGDVELGVTRFVVCAGPDVGAEITIDATSPSRVLVGQSRTCQLVLRDKSVSRRHVAFDLHPRGVTVVDLGSTNGTRVNGVRIVEAKLEGAELIAIGQTTLRVELLGARPDVALSPLAGFGRLVGASVAMRRLYPLFERLAQSALPVVIEGETGTGKELLAEALHEMGPRRSKPFLVFDCVGTPREAVISTLFGDGASEGASLVEQADGGTLLLDEVADLGDEAQRPLLRLLHHREARHEGRRAVTVDVRILVTTRRDLDKEVQSGRLRDDLYYRLSALHVELPPLRDREEDVALLARTIWTREARARPLPTDFLAGYEHYRWPGNVRELENAVVRRLMLGPLEPARRTSGVPPASATSSDVIDRVLAKDLSLSASRAEVVEELERRYLTMMLERHGGSVSRAAAASGVARRYFQILRARHAK
jgi:DNA-binding NtrC family response regulator